MAIANIRLHYEAQQAKLDIQTRPRIFELKTTAPQIQLNTKAAQVEITSRPYGTMEIDQSPCRASYGIKNHTEFMHDVAELGRQTALEAVGRIAQEGDRMAAIESHEDAIINIATESTYSEMPSITWAPIANPIIRYTPNPPQFNPVPGSVELSLDRGTVDINYQPAKVEGRMIKYQNIRYWTTGANIDLQK